MSIRDLPTVLAKCPQSKLSAQNKQAVRQTDRHRVTHIQGDASPELLYAKYHHDRIIIAPAIALFVMLTYPFEDRRRTGPGTRYSGTASPKGKAAAAYTPDDDDGKEEGEDKVAPPQASTTVSINHHAHPMAFFLVPGRSLQSQH